MIDEKTLKQPVKRIWVLGDLHLGVRANSVEWLEIQQEFFEKVLIPTLKKEVKPGDVLVQVGDAFDNRKSIDFFGLECAVRHQAASDTLVTCELLLRIWEGIQKEASNFTELKNLAKQGAWIPRN